MNKYRMEQLRDLSAEEEQVKLFVRQHIQQGERVQQRRFAWSIFGAITATLVVIIFVVSLIQLTSQTTIAPTGSLFVLEDIELQPLPVRESNYFITTLSVREAITLTSIELININGNTIDYDDAHIALRVWAIEGARPGQYTREEILPYPFDLFEQLSLNKGDEQQLMIEVMVNDQYEARDDLRLQFTFEMNGERQQVVYEWGTLAKIDVIDFAFHEIYMNLPLDDAERHAYEKLKETKEAEALAGLSPMSVTKLYFVSLIEGDDALTYSFYTTRPEHIRWSLQEQLSFPVFDTSSLGYLQQHLLDIMAGTFIETSSYEGYIAFWQEGQEYESGFILIQNDEGIWQVAFMPMQ